MKNRNRDFKLQFGCKTDLLDKVSFHVFVNSSNKFVKSVLFTLSSNFYDILLTQQETNLTAQNIGV